MAVDRDSSIRYASTTLQVTSNNLIIKQLCPFIIINTCIDNKARISDIFCGRNTLLPHIQQFGRPGQLLQ